MKSIMFSIIFNYLNSYEDLGLLIEHRPNIPVPQKNIKLHDIDGRNGSLVEDYGTYKDIEISISFSFKEKNDIYERIEYIKKWLLIINDNKLFLSDKEDFFYKVKYIKCNDIIRSLKILGRFTTTFVCEPFLFSNSKNEFTSQPVILNNYGIESNPTIYIYGNGNITLNINDVYITLKDIKDYIIIDSTSNDAYNNFEFLNNKMYGNFPTLKEGQNIISWTGNVTKIQIEPHWKIL